MRILATFDAKDYQDTVGIYEKYTVRGIIMRDGKLAMQCSRDGEYKLPGGGVESGESRIDALVREVREETGLTLTRFRLCSVITFVSDTWEGEYMYLFHATDFTGTLAGCDEGELVWVKKENVLALPTWEGDRIFLQKMAAGDDFFTLKLRYEGDLLCEAVLNGTQRLKG